MFHKRRNADTRQTLENIDFNGALVVLGHLTIVLPDDTSGEVATRYGRVRPCPPGHLLFPAPSDPGLAQDPADAARPGDHPACVSAPVPSVHPPQVSSARLRPASPPSPSAPVPLRLPRPAARTDRTLHRWVEEHGVRRWPERYQGSRRHTRDSPTQGRLDRTQSLGRSATSWSTPSRCPTSWSLLTSPVGPTAASCWSNRALPANPRSAGASRCVTVGMTVGVVPDAVFGHVRAAIPKCGSSWRPIGPQCPWHGRP